ncbi:MAG: TRAM domain-containing protein, partial [Burkholderiaceae bacterium]
VLVEGPSRRDANELMGRTQNNRVVNFDGGELGQSLIGRLLDVRITQSMSHTLRATPCMPISGSATEDPSPFIGHEVLLGATN